MYSFEELIDDSHVDVVTCSSDGYGYDAKMMS